MARSTLLAAGVLTAALTAGGAAGMILGTPSISGAQESTTTQDDATTTAPDDGSTTAPDDGTATAPDDGTAGEGCAEGEGRGGPPPAGEAPADEAPATEGSSTSST